MRTTEQLSWIKKKLTTLSFLINEPYELLEFNESHVSTVEHLLRDCSIAINTEYDLFKEYQDYTNLAIELNKLSPAPVLWCLSIAEIKQKDFITVKEFHKLYGLGGAWQRTKRQRLYDSLPTVSLPNKKILYNHTEIRHWLDNNVFK